MKTAIRIFYSLLLWATNFELAIAKNAPERNRHNIEALTHDADEYSRELSRLELNLSSTKYRA